MEAEQAVRRLVTEYVEEHGEQTLGHEPFGILRLRLDMELAHFLHREYLVDVVERAYGVHLAENGNHPLMVRNAALTVNNQPELIESQRAHLTELIGQLLDASGYARTGVAA
jgi:hypothetical protein